MGARCRVEQRLLPRWVRHFIVCDVELEDLEGHACFLAAGGALHVVATPRRQTFIYRHSIRPIGSLNDLEGRGDRAAAFNAEVVPAEVQ